MSNTALTKYMELEWLVEPSPTIPCYCASGSQDLLLHFKLHGPWNPKCLYEWLLFTVHFVPLGEFAAQPVFPLPPPYGRVNANGFTLIPHKEVRAGHQDLVSFNEIRIDNAFPGHYRLQVSAFIATQHKVRKQLLGHILSRPVHIQSRQEEVMPLYKQRLPHCGEVPCSTYCLQ
jgi:hypothetical protein